MKHADISLLVVEDDDVDYLSIERALKKSQNNFCLVRAKNGGEALTMLEDEIVRKPMIAILDLQMPRMNGIEFLMHLRKSPKYSDSVVFVLSTSDDPGDIFDCYRHQIAAYFEKGKLGSSYAPLIEMLNCYERNVSLPHDFR